jgi:hypothetical protein
VEGAPLTRSAAGPIAVAVCLLCASTAAGDVRYAAPTAIGPEPCLQSNPCDIEKAVEGTAPTDVDNGDEIILLPGAYSNVFEIQVSKAIFVHGSGTPVPRINTGDATGLSVNHSGATVSDLSILHSAGSFALQMNNGLVERVSARTVGAGSGVACFIGGGTLRDSTCLNERTSPGDALAYNITDAERSSVLRNVTAVSTAPSGYGARYAANTSSLGATVTVDARNVIFSGVTADIRADEQLGSTMTLAADHSNFAEVELGGTGAASVTPAGTAGNQTDPPQFVNVAGGDLHQLPTSPTVDHGAGDPSLGARDLDGDARTLGSAPDIGADELIPVPGGPPDADVTAPETSIDQAPKRRSKKRKARFAFSSSEVGSTFECSLDGAAFKPCSSPLKRKVKRRKHRFAVRAIDAAGNVDRTPAKARWKVRKR